MFTNISAVNFTKDGRPPILSEIYSFFSIGEEQIII